MEYAEPGEDDEPEGAARQTGERKRDRPRHRGDEQERCETDGSERHRETSWTQREIDRRKREPRRQTWSDRDHPMCPGDRHATGMANQHRIQMPAPEPVAITG